jgi:1,4-dihydroxy-2-naphthoyl-CoA synthase
MPDLELSYPRPDIAVLTLNRPEKLNALSYELVEGLHATIDGIAANNECRVVVLTGAGRGFCSGLDLTAPSPPEAGGGTEFPRSGMRWQERIADLTARIHRLRQPVIAAVNGPAYGGGFGIALAVAETLCGYGKFGLESTKQVLWANLDASSLESALHLENRSQIQASTSGEVREASAAFRHRPR